jgi:hypothetical protein
MKRLFAITVVMLLSSAMFFVVVCAGGDSVTRPMKAMWTGNLYVLGPCTDLSFPAGAFQTINIGKGVSTLTGESDFIIEYCTFFSSASSMAGSGWGIITAANGDTIHVSVDVTIDLSKTPPEWSETEFMVGGTGRFQGATGSSESGGSWTSGPNPFPFGSSPPIPPRLLQAPQGWIGTSIGEVTF